MSSFFWAGVGGGGEVWRNRGYTFKWNYSGSLLLTLLRILLRNKWWHWKSASTSSITGYSILKRPFEMQLHFGAANFCILVYSEYEKKGVIQGTHFRNARKQMLLIPLFSSFVICQLVKKSWQAELWMQRKNTLSLPHRLLLPLEKEFWPEAKPKKVLSHTES